MDRFVRVRLVHANGLDLSVFQFDPDLSFVVFFLNADKTVYGRFGTRSDDYRAERDISLVGLRKAMLGALELHASYPDNKASLTAKRGPKPQYASLAESPWMRTRGRGRGCMHCHHIGTAEQMSYRSVGKAIPDRVLFPWPMPDVVGLKLDPREKAKVADVVSGSAAADGGFRTGDELLTFEGQPLLSIADVQWALHRAPQPAKLKAEVLRAGEKHTLTLSLDERWRRRADVSWRTTAYQLHDNLLGGMSLTALTTADREKAGLPESGMALRIALLFRSAPAAEAGFRRKDIFLACDGKSDPMSVNDFLAYCAQQKKPGDTVDITLLRDGKRLKLKLRVD